MALIPDAGPDTRNVAFAGDLAAHGERVALITAHGELTYRELAARVAQAGRRLGTARRLVLLEGANTVDAVVGYLAALAGGHPVLLAPDGAIDAMIEAYDPDVVVRAGGAFGERHAVSRHALHPDLAVLLSTSGSTGSPKLVRLSHRNVQANAEAIAGFLGIRASDRAATTLPMHYCYGLSVLNSHLLTGAGLILTDLSVADSCFWATFRRHHGTTFAAVPYTFDLLDRVGFATMDLPSLRYVTQAGGRLAPDRVRRYAELGQRKGWDLFVMYGQTEATARMAYLPPDLAAAYPAAIGRPIPGGSFRLAALPDCTEPDTGELVYTGPNVMLGYAESPADLRLGRTVDALHTGDVARLTAAGLYELVGRRSRFVKVFGLRIDLQRVEALLEQRGVTASCAGTDEQLVVAVQGYGDAEHIRRLVARQCGLPVRAVRVSLLAELPRLPTGKPDHRAIRTLTAASAAASPAGARPKAAPGSAAAAADNAAAGVGADLRDLFAEVLECTDVTDDSTFVSLGGDSLSYVEMSLRLEQALGHLPPDWHTTRIGDLRRGPRRRALRVRSIETSVALRAVAIILIVGSHIDLLDLPGGAHVLLGVAGFNFARFHLTTANRRRRAGHLATSIARIAVPSMAWIALVCTLTDDYDLANVFLLNEVLGPRNGTERYFWFVETLVYLLLGLLALLAVPVMDRIERRLPYALPMGLMTVALLARYDLPLVDAPVHVPTPCVALWLFALGWAAAKATGGWQRLWITAVVVATVPGFFGKPIREVIVVAGLCLLVWVPSLPGLRSVNRIAGLLATSSLFIYLTHWQVYPHLREHSGVLALVASLVVGILYAMVVARTSGWLSGRWARRRAGAAGDPAPAVTHVVS